LFLAASLTACGGSSSSGEPPIVKPPEGIPTNTIIQASFRDQDGDTGKLAGTITLKATEVYPEDTAPRFPLALLGG